MKYLKLYETKTEHIREIIEQLNPEPYKGWVFYNSNNPLWDKNSVNVDVLYMVPFYTNKDSVMTQLFMSYDGFIRDQLPIDFDNIDKFSEWYVNMSHERIDLAEKALIVMDIIKSMKMEVYEWTKSRYVPTKIEINVETADGKLLYINSYASFGFPAGEIRISYLKMESIAQVYDALEKEYPDIVSLSLAKQQGFIG